MVTMKVLDLFAGVGGIRMGFSNAGFTTAMSCDFDKNCALTYNLNHNQPPLAIDDVSCLNADDMPSFDVLTAGFPCQPFSFAGKRLGFSETRGTLFFDIARILSQGKPQVVFLENVKGLVGHNDGSTFQTILSVLNELGYFVKYQVLNSKHYNVPQNRERIYIVGFRDRDQYEAFHFPQPTDLTTSVFDLVEDDIDEKYYIGESLYNKVKDQITDPAHVYQWRYNYVRQHKTPGVCPCLVTGRTNPLIIDTDGIRYLTPKETFNVQGFPLDFKLPEIADRHLYKQSGNSVSVPVITAIAKEIWKVSS